MNLDLSKTPKWVSTLVTIVAYLLWLNLFDNANSPKDDPVPNAAISL